MFSIFVIELHNFVSPSKEESHFKTKIIFFFFREDTHKKSVFSGRILMTAYFVLLTTIWLLHGVLEWSKLKVLSLFLTSRPSICMFDLFQAYSAKKNHLWPQSMWKVVKISKYCLFWASCPKKCMFWYVISIKYEKKTGGGHDHITFKINHKSGNDHISQVPTL